MNLQNRQNLVPLIANFGFYQPNPEMFLFSLWHLAERKKRVTIQKNMITGYMKQSSSSEEAKTLCKGVNNDLLNRASW